MDGLVAFACEKCGKSVSLPAERCGRVEVCPQCSEHIDVPKRDDPRCRPVAPAGSHGKSTQPRTPRQLWLEVGAVLCLGVVPALYGACVNRWHGTEWRFPHFELSLIENTLRTAAPLLLILYILRERWSKFGLVRVVWLPDIVCGVVIWIAGAMAFRACWLLAPDWLIDWLPWPESLEYHSADHGVIGVVLLLFGSLANGFGEELMMRGYLLVRFEQLLRSSWKAVLVTAALFASYHFYQGVPGIINTLVLGLLYGAAFCVLRRLWPLALAHAIADFVGGF